MKQRCGCVSRFCSPLKSCRFDVQGMCFTYVGRGHRAFYSRVIYHVSLCCNQLLHSIDTPVAGFTNKGGHSIDSPVAGFTYKGGHHLPNILRVQPIGLKMAKMSEAKMSRAIRRTKWPQRKRSCDHYRGGGERGGGGVFPEGNNTLPQKCHTHRTSDLLN